MREALISFITTIELAGGVKEREGKYYPHGDPQWGYLGDAYIKACNSIGHKPVIVELCDHCGSEKCECFVVSKK